MRRFEHPSGTFWAIEIGRVQLTVRWGRIGTTGQQRDLGLTGRDDSVARARDLIARQVALGYNEVTDTKEVVESIVEGKRWYRRFEGGGAYLTIVVDRAHVFEWRGELAERVAEPVHVWKTATFAEAKAKVAGMIAVAITHGMIATTEVEPEVELSPARIVIGTNIALEDQCRASPDDPDPWVVYADWLMVKNDPRGEIAALRMQGKEAEAEAKLAQHRKELFDDGEDGDDLVFRDAIALTSWSHGFPTGATIKIDFDARTELDAIVRRFLALPIAAFIDELRLGLARFESNNDWGPTIRAIAESAQAETMRILCFDEFDANEQEISWTAFGDFSAVWQHLPRLEVLSIKSGEGGTLGTIVLPNLRKFVRISGGLRATELASITNAHWPELEHLELWFGQDRYHAEGHAAQLLPIFEARGLAKLSHLGLVNCEFSESALQHLIGSPLLRQLRSLDLSNGILANREVDLLVANAAQLAHLTSIDVSSNFLLDLDLVRLRKVLPRVISQSQRELEDADDDDVDGRYAAVGE